MTLLYLSDLIFFSTQDRERENDLKTLRSPFSAWIQNIARCFA